MSLKIVQVALKSPPDEEEEIEEELPEPVEELVEGDPGPEEAGDEEDRALSGRRDQHVKDRRGER